MIYFFLIFYNIIFSPPSAALDTTVSVIDSLYYSFCTEELEKYPIQDIRNIISLQPGVVDCRGDLHIRGGFAENIEYWVDGVPLYITNLPFSIIKRVTIDRNPISGRYGRPNVVEIETKEMFRSASWFAGFDEGMNGYELSASGIYNDRLKYSFTGYTKSRDYERSYLFDLSNTDMDLYYLLGSMKYEVSPSTDIGFGLIAVRGQGGLYSTFRAVPLYPTKRCDNSEKYNSDWLRSSWLEKGRQFYAYLRQNVNQHFSYSINFVNFAQHEIIGERDNDFEQERRFFQDLEFEPWWMYTYDPITLDQYNDNDEYIYPYGVQNVFYFGSPGLWHEVERSSNLINADFDARISDWMSLKGGFESRVTTIDKEMADSIYSLPARDSVTSSGDTIRVVVPEYREISENVSWEKYEKKPLSGDLWLDLTAHKSKFKVTSGIRLDFYNPRIWKYRNPLRPRNPDGTYDTIPSELAWKINPRLYISYFPEPRIEISFGYTRYHFIMPYSSNYYGNSGWDFYYFKNITVNFSRFNYTVRQQLQPELSRVGLFYAQQPELSRVWLFYAQLTYSIKDNFVLSINAFRKEIYGLPRIHFFAASPEPYFAYKYDGEATTNGAEISLQYGSHSSLSFALSYAFQNSQWKSFSRGGYYCPSPWDQRHCVRILLSKDIKRGWVLGEFKPFDNTNISLLFKANSGLPYTKTDELGRALGDRYAERKEWNHITNIKLTKGIDIAGLNLYLFLEIDNLFNTKNVLNVYPNTGKPDYNGMLSNYEDYVDYYSYLFEGEDRIPVGMNYLADERRDLDGDGYITRDEWYESYVNAYTDLMRDPFNYGPPRKISVGMQVAW